MFWGNKQALRQTNDELSRSRDEIAALARENADLRAQLQAQQQASATKEEECNTLMAVLRHLGAFSDTLVGSQQSLGQMAGLLSQERNQAIAAAEVSVTSGQTTTEIASNLHRLAENSSLTAREVGSLAKQADEIGAIVQLIHDIADQTNLLALNAAIEAARAGESGRGFAVVADEVRKLAERTAKATKDIESLVVGIRQDSAGAKEAMDILSSTADEFSQRGQKATEDMEQLVDLSRKMEIIIAGSALKSFVEVAKVDHLVFKFRIYMALFGLIELAPGNVATHTACRLGLWYYQGEGREFFSRLPGYREIEAPHIEVHRHGIAALECRQKNDLGGMLNALERMEQASQGVIDNLQRMADAAASDSSLLCHQ